MESPSRRTSHIIDVKVIPENFLDTEFYVAVACRGHETTSSDHLYVIRTLLDPGVRAFYIAGSSPNLYQGARSALREFRVSTTRAEC